MDANNNGRIGKRSVDLLRPGSAETRFWDTELKGFCVRVHPSGRRVYAVKYRTVEGRQRWFTIGEHGSPWTPDQARDKALKVLAAVADGKDPHADRHALKADLTVNELIEAYLKDGPASKPDKRASSWTLDASNLDRHVRPLMGRKMVKAVSQEDCARMVTAIIAGKTAVDERTRARGRAIVKGGAGAAERCLGTVNAMFTWAERRGLIQSVPTKGVRLPRPAARERFLSPKEAQHLLTVVKRMEDQARLASHHADIIRLLMMTGARRSEITCLQWDEVDLERNRLLLPPARTKSGGRTGDRRVALSSAAVQLLASRPRTSAYVFPSSKDSKKPAAALQKVWNRVRTEADLPELRIHDLRHSFASLALARGASLPLIGKALGHSSPRVTERYAHLADDALRALADEVGGDLS